jgi:hypothetical protein
MSEHIDKRQKVDELDLNTSDELVDAPQNIQIMLANQFSNIEGDTYQEKLDTLANCNCCERHQVTKPTKLAPWVDTPFNGTAYTPCECKCRHLARFICRQVS